MNNGHGKEAGDGAEVTCTTSQAVLYVRLRQVHSYTEQGCDRYITKTQGPRNPEQSRKFVRGGGGGQEEPKSIF